MTRGKLEKIRENLSALRGSSRKPVELERVARKLGRKQSARGKEPTWINEFFPDLRPISIPHHSREIGTGLVNRIIDDLEAMDLPAWENEVENSGDGNETN